jgi:hypothetical protein
MSLDTSGTRKKLRETNGKWGAVWYEKNGLEWACGHSEFELGQWIESNIAEADRPSLVRLIESYVGECMLKESRANSEDI